ncbi:exodeoxyribonuclease VII small subunit [Chitinivorax tropicus]|uniref:Exodeoxyribonuclease 7 small subunit n=1 Tax=Chitinivorax tropicus TaxID=714531 RepID=A0A840MRK3_9PROT|nr:exodeoxyribonuclease VII small subunit [Chitinivorax tropicus]MBB5019709.1 exodeoxyribonuclease VII small subunit [Chitinivorax tropicus]
MPKSPKPAAPASFEAALADLEKLVAEMESGQLTLEASLSAYKQGTALLQFCQTTLQDAQQQVRILENDNLHLFGQDEQP